MIINIKVIPNASKNRIAEVEGQLKAYVTAPPADGKANKALVELLSEHFNTPKSRIRIARGKTSRHKTVEITC